MSGVQLKVSQSFCCIHIQRLNPCEVTEHIFICKGRHLAPGALWWSREYRIEVQLVNSVPKINPRDLLYMCLDTLKPKLKPGKAKIPI